MDHAKWDRLLAEAQAAHAANAELCTFVTAPKDVRAQKVAAFHIPSSDMMQAETGLFTERLRALRDAFVDCAPEACWRETYKDTNIGQDFLDRFGCFALIGGGGAFMSDEVWSWMVYMPAGLHYPWHHHPGEEAYLVIAGEAEFHRKGMESQVLREGDVCVHASNQPHAMTTYDNPVMAYVVWRNGFGTPPVLTE